MQERILIKVGEIFLKGNNKRIFERTLYENIKTVVNKVGSSLGCSFSIHSFGSVISIYKNDYKTSSMHDKNTDNNTNLDVLIPYISNIFGISRFSKALKVEKTMFFINECAIKMISNDLSFKIKTFKIETKRIDKSFLKNSYQISSEIGESILSKFNLSVDVKNPDINLTIEIREDAAYLYLHNFLGLGGLPAGSSGIGLSLISGGIDSPVASFMLAKRGLNLKCLHFSTPPYTSQMTVQKVQKLVEKLSLYVPKISLLIVNYTKIQEEIRKKCQKEFFTLISRRIMMKIAQKIAIKHKYGCVITGESLGQVASQTLSSIGVVNEVMANDDNFGPEIPVLRPLIGMDKDEITQIAKRIGTFDISIEPFEDCCSIFSPKHPILNPKIKNVKFNENKLHEINYLIDDCIEKIECYDF